MTDIDKPTYPGDSDSTFYLMGGLLLLYVAATATAWLSLMLAGTAANPLTVLFALGMGKQRWPTAATVWAAVLAVVQAGMLAWAVRRWWRRRSGRSRFDFATQWLANRADVTPLRRNAALEVAERLGHPQWPGVSLGVLVEPNGTPDYDRVTADPDQTEILVQDGEQLSIDFWGPRRGKTTTRIIPAICEAPGAVLTTSNKRDIVDATRGVRKKAGPVYVFDPQRIVGSKPEFWVDLIAVIRTGDRDMWDVRAERLADIFLAGSTPDGSRPDAFFDPEGRDLLARLFLAAAVGAEPITKVYEWIVEPNRTPLDHLRNSEFTAAAGALKRFVGYSDRQKDGLFGTAKKMVNVLSRQSIGDWVKPKPGVPQFDPEEFVRSRGTLYVMSKAGVDSAGALATALTWAVCDAAERYGEQQGGRLRTPMLAALDELANVIKWPDLPDKFSHYGSRGIIVMAILQNWSQGVACFGADRMQQLWDAAPIRVYGGGVADQSSLGILSELIGDRWEIATSTNYSRPAGLLATGQSHMSVGRDARQLRILSIAHLHQLPRQRAIVLWGGRPAMIRPVPYWDRPYRKAIEASLEEYDPAARVRKSLPQQRTSRGGLTRLLRRQHRALSSADDTASSQRQDLIS